MAVDVGVTTATQKGKKLSFADWISIVGREETPFLSMIGKQKVTNTEFKWQEEALQEPLKTPFAEGSDAAGDDTQATTEHSNITQIFRRVVGVSDTAQAQALYGKSNDLRWQTRMRGIELRRDVEYAYLNNAAKAETSGTRTTGGFAYTENTAAEMVFATITGTTKDDAATIESAIAAAGQKLFETGGKPTVLMMHPAFSTAISALQELDSSRLRIFRNEKSVITEVNNITTPLGQQLRVVYNVLMPQDAIYMLNPADWTDCVMRDYSITPLAKTGSSQKMMLETERGLRSRNPKYSAVLKVHAEAVK